MRNILFISSYLNRAGTEAFMMNVFRGVNSSEFHIDFLLFSQEETDYSREVEKAGSSVFRLPSRHNNPLSYYLELIHFFKKYAPSYQVIHWCGNSLSSIFPILLAWMHKIPIRIVHGHNSSAQGLHNKILHVLFRRLVSDITTHHLACSQSAAKWFFQNQSCTIIKNGVDLNYYSYNENIRQLIRKKLGIPTDTIVLGHIGRFSPEKNHIFLLQLFAQYHQLFPNSKLMLIGMGALYQDMIKEAQLMNIVDHTMFLGERSDVGMLLQAMDCFVMPSLFEGLPFVLVEAQAADLPCILSDTICSDIALTDKISFISLNSPIKIWCDTIQKYIHFPRENSSFVLQQAGYSLNDSLISLQHIYSL